MFNIDKPIQKKNKKTFSDQNVVKYALDSTLKSQKFLIKNYPVFRKCYCSVVLKLLLELNGSITGFGIEQYRKERLWILLKMIGEQQFPK